MVETATPADIRRLRKPPPAATWTHSCRGVRMRSEIVGPTVIQSCHVRRPYLRLRDPAEARSRSTDRYCELLSPVPSRSRETCCDPVVYGQALPLRSPNLNAFAERWVSSVQQEFLSKLILFGEASLRRALTEYIDHHHFEPNHQGKGNLLLFASMDVPPKCRTIHRRDRPGGLLKLYSRAA